MRSAVCVALLAVLLATACGSHPPVPPPAVGGPLPAFTLPALDGPPVSSASLRGRPVLLNFWATWCAPCLREIPLLQQLDREGRVKVVGIALDEEGAGRVRPFVARQGIRYMVLLGNQGLFERMGGSGIPHSVLVDGSQAVLAVYRGALTREAVEADLRRGATHPGDPG